MNNLRSNLKSIESKTDDVRVRAAESLESAAASLRAAANHSAEAIHDLADGAGKKLDSTATLIRPCSSSKMLGGLRTSVRRNPMGTIALATAVGLVAGFSCRASLR